MTKIWPKPVAQSLPDQVAEAIVERITDGALEAGAPPAVATATRTIDGRRPRGRARSG